MKIDYQLLGISPDASAEEVRERLNTLLRKWYYRLNSPKLEHRQEAERMVQELEKIGSQLAQLEIKEKNQQKMVQQKTKLPRIVEGNEQESMELPEEKVIYTKVDDPALSQEVAQVGQSKLPKEGVAHNAADDPSVQETIEAFQTESADEVARTAADDPSVQEAIEAFQTESADEVTRTAADDPSVQEITQVNQTKSPKEEVVHTVVNEQALRKAAKKGKVEAMVKLGEHLLQGDGIGQDQEGVYWLQKAVKIEKNPQAMLSLGQYFLKQNNGKEKKKGEYWLKKAAKTGLIEAMRELGFYATSPKERAKWLRKAGEAGDPIAMKELGSWLLRGKGIKPSNKWGLYWLRQAAEAGHLEAMRELALYLLKEKENKKALKEGRKWLHQAAEQGDPVAKQMITQS